MTNKEYFRKYIDDLSQAVELLNRYKRLAFELNLYHVDYYGNLVPNEDNDTFLYSKTELHEKIVEQETKVNELVDLVAHYREIIQ